MEQVCCRESLWRNKEALTLHHQLETKIHLYENLLSSTCITFVLNGVILDGSPVVMCPS